MQRAGDGERRCRALGSKMQLNSVEMAGLLGDVVDWVVSGGGMGSG